MSLSVTFHIWGICPCTTKSRSCPARAQIQALSCILPPNASIAVAQAEEDRKAAAKALLEEVSQSNKQLEQRKMEQKQAEVEEDLRIAEYLRIKEAREQVGRA